jgi:hypothetical protein
MQTANRSEVEVQILRVEFEALGNLKDGLLQLHQGNADVLDFFRREGFFFETPDGLALHQLTDELDESKDEFDDRALDVFWIGIPTQRRGLWGSSGSWGAWGTWTAALAQTPARLPRCSSLPFLRAKAGPFHALLRFALPSFAGAPITFLIS